MTYLETTQAHKVDVSRGSHRGELSHQWFTRPNDQRFLSLNDLRDYTQQRYDESAAEVIDNRRIEFLAPEAESIADTKIMSVGLPNGIEVNPTNWSFGQLAGLADAPASYLRKLPSQIATDALAWGMRQNRSVESVKAYWQSNGEQELRAVTGPTYGRIPDFEVVEAVQQIAGDGLGSHGWKVPGVIDWSSQHYNPNVDVTKDTTTLFASDRDVWLFLCDDRNPIEIGKLQDGSPDLVFRGFYVANSEVGAKSLVIACMYLRGVCQNRCLWGVEGFQQLDIRHTSGAPDRFIDEAAPALVQFANGSTEKFLDGVQAARDAKIASDEDEALAWLRARGLSRRRASQIVTAVAEEEGHPIRSVWDAAQGITAIARSIPHQDARIELERVAGGILDRIAA